MFFISHIFLNINMITVSDFHLKIVEVIYFSFNVLKYITSLN